MTRCRYCLIPTTRPDTEFVAGVCSACLSYERRKTIDWRAREEKLLNLLNDHHGECIVASSGGKDSTWITLKLLEVGARPICVTASTCMLTAVGRQNLDNLARFAKTIEVTPNRDVRRRLNRLGQLLVGDISWPEHVSIFTTPFRMAQALGQGLIFYGENPQEAYGGPAGTDAAFELTPRWRSEFGGFLGLRPADLVGKDRLTESDLADYKLPEKCDAKAYFLGQFYPWDSHRNAMVATEHGFRTMLPTPANWWPHENLDNAMTGLHDYGMFRKFGFGRCASQLSVDIRMGRVAREAAAVVCEERDGLFPEQYAGVPLAAVLGQIGLSRTDLMASFDKFSK